MSRIGKKPIEIPQGTKVIYDGNEVVVEGPKGKIVRNIKPEVDIKIDNSVVRLSSKNKTKFSLSLWGTYASHIRNMIKGVNDPYQKNLIIEGVGFRAEQKGDKIVLNLGFSHQIEVNIPEGIVVEIKKNKISISGIDKEKVGELASKIRALKKPEPYKGKGIRYDDEVVRRKQGKKTV